MLRTRQFLAAILLILCNCYAGVVLAATKPTAIDSIVAEVNESVITQSQLDDEVANARRALSQNNNPSKTPTEHELRQHVLEQLINQKLQIQLAKANDLTVDKAMLDQTLARIAQEHGITVAQLPDALAQQGIDFANFRHKINEQLLIQQLQQREVASLVKISEQEVNQIAQQLAKQPRSNATDDTTYQVQDILIEVAPTATVDQKKTAQQLANQLVTQLKTNANAQQVVSIADSAASHVKFTDLGERKLVELPDLFSKIIVTLKAGDITNPIQAPNGWHILKVISVHATEPVVPGQITETKVRHILIKPNVLNNTQVVKARLLEIRNKIVHGADFAQLAEANSEDPGSASRGGDLGWVKPGTLDPTFEQTMNQLKPNEVSQPFASQFGWHLVQVLARRHIDDTTAQLREQARQMIFQRKFAQALDNWLKQIRTQAYIKILN